MLIWRTGLVLLAIGCSRQAQAGSDVAAATTAAAAPSGGATTPTEYQARGTVRSLELAQQRVFIAHEDIPGYMKAMVMPFRVTSAQAHDLAPGVRVELSFHDDGDGNLIIDTIRRAP